jgi:hypothetical protein
MRVSKVLNVVAAPSAKLENPQFIGYLYLKLKLTPLRKTLDTPVFVHQDLD